VIVSSTGAREHLEACLASLRRFPLEMGEMQVHLVDNASADGTPKLVRERFPEVDLELLDRNTGFCVPNNLCLRRTSAPYALLLNPDTELVEPALDRMIEMMEGNPRIAVSSCRLTKRDGTFDHAAKRSFPTLIGALGHFLRVGRGPGAPAWLAQYRAPEIGEREAGEVDAVNGAFMLLRREALREVGLLDEGYPTPGMEDLDWCYRAKQRGWKVWYEGGVRVIHVKGGATVRGGHRGLHHNLAFHRSMGRFYRKFYAGRRPLLDLAVYLAIAVKFAIAVTRSTIAHRRVTLVGGGSG
jgi:N-acetylglucosaminyl-diphospho-decaprenol L-rhamnosyltransferase